MLKIIPGKATKKQEEGVDFQSVVTKGKYVLLTYCYISTGKYSYFLVFLIKSSSLI